MFKMYELTEMYNNVLDLINDEDADVVALEEALKTIKTNIEDKAENIAKLIKMTDSQANALREEEKRLATKRRALNNRVDSLKGYMEESLKATGVNKVDAGIFTVALQNNPQSVKFIDEDLIPTEYKEEVITTKIPKKKILDDIKAGKKVAGVEVVQTQSLRIR